VSTSPTCITAVFVGTVVVLGLVFAALAILLA
jgi:hypothetical protein